MDRLVTRRQVLTTGAMGALAVTHPTLLTGLVHSEPGMTIGPDGMPEWGSRDIPMTGSIVDPFFRRADGLVMQAMREFGVPGMVLSITHRGRFLVRRGYGYCDAGFTRKTTPDTLMRVASVAKPLIHLAVDLLISEGASLAIGSKRYPINEEIPVFRWLYELGVRPPAGSDPDPRIWTITLKHLIMHESGVKQIDPGWPLAELLHIQRPANRDEWAGWVMGQPLDFDPGSKSQYSNTGYGIIAHLTERLIPSRYGRDWTAFVRDRVFGPAGNSAIVQSRSRPEDRDPRETFYWHVGRGPSTNPWNRKLQIPICDGGGGFAVDAMGMYATSAPAQCQYMTYWFGDRAIKLIDPRTGNLREGVNNGSLIFHGGMPGTLASIYQARWSYVNMAFMANRDTPPSTRKWELFDALVHDIIEPLQTMVK